MSEAKDQVILAMRNETPPAKWIRIAERVGWTRDKVQRRYSKLLAEPDSEVDSEATEQPEASELDADHPDLLARDERIAVLEDTVQRQKAQIKATHRSSALFKDLAKVVAQHTQPLGCATRHAPAADDDRPASGVTDADMVLILSDEHADEVVSREATWGLERYDFDVFRCRLQRLHDMIVEYATVHLPAHRFDRLYLLKLGDGVNGWDVGAFVTNTVRRPGGCRPAGGRNDSGRRSLGSREPHPRFRRYRRSGGSCRQPRNSTGCSKS